MLALFHSGCWHFFTPDIGKDTFRQKPWPKISKDSTFRMSHTTGQRVAQPLPAAASLMLSLRILNSPTQRDWACKAAIEMKLQQRVRINLKRTIYYILLRKSTLTSMEFTFHFATNSYNIVHSRLHEASIHFRGEKNQSFLLIL